MDKPVERVSMDNDVSLVAKLLAKSAGAAEGQNIKIEFFADLTTI